MIKLETIQQPTNLVSLGSADDLRASIRRKSKLKGRQVDDASLREVELTIGNSPTSQYRRDLLIEYLHLLNDQNKSLFERHLVALAKLMNVPMAEVFEVATFYHHFEVIKGNECAPSLTIRVCDGLSCELAGAQDLLARLPAYLGLKEGDGVKVIAAPCVGRCEQAPVAIVHQHPVIKASLNTVLNAVASKWHKHPAPNGLSACAPEYIDFDDYLANGGYKTLSDLLTGKLNADAVLKIMEDSGLRGLGGAGFPAGKKWRIVRDQPSSRLMTVNIDEGEPGTFKDRTYLERDPHRFLEGMLIAAHVVGVDACYVYLRDEYHGCREILENEIAKLQSNAIADIRLKLPLIELRRGAGAYICGEESAMIESIEGKRGEPRMRPPYIAQIGLFGRPTLAHNFETLHWVRDILEKGPGWFTGFGRNGRTGFRSFSVSGRVTSPGVKLAPAGISLIDLVNEYCGGMAEGHTLYAYLPGGASGGIFPASLANLPLDFDTLQPHGGFIGSAAVIVLGHLDKARDAAINMMRFFKDESCGQCTPCRVGTAKAAKLMEASQWDNDILEDLNVVMTDASICGLGQAAPNPVRCVQKYFSHEIA
jgi:formate dehydrogenase beta subunit